MRNRIISRWMCRTLRRISICRLRYRRVTIRWPARLDNRSSISKKIRIIQVVINQISDIHLTWVDTVRQILRLQIRLLFFQQNAIPPISQTLPATPPPQQQSQAAQKTSPGTPTSTVDTAATPEKPQSNGTPELKTPTKTEGQQINHLSSSPVPSQVPQVKKYTLNAFNKNKPKNRSTITHYKIFLLNRFPHHRSRCLFLYRWQTQTQALGQQNLLPVLLVLGVLLGMSRSS